MKARTSRWPLAASLASLALLAGCGGDAPVQSASWPDSECRRLGLDSQHDPVALLTPATEVLRTTVIPAAKASGGSFPAFNAWIEEVTSAVGKHQVSDGGEASDSAQSEITAYLPPRPVTHDVFKLQWFEEQTNLRKAAANITRRMRCQTDDRRSAGSDYLWAVLKL
jgi:hypothetical protein